MKPILVTGGAGFIGSNFVRQWLREENSLVVNLDKLTYAGNTDSLHDVVKNPRHVFVHGDLNDTKLLAHLFQKYSFSAVVNFAAESHVDRSIDGPAVFVETNVLGTFRLLEAARCHYSQLSHAERDAFRLLHVSTDEVYGSLGPTGRFTEQNRYAPNSPYSASKAAADHFVRAYHHTYGLPVLTTNCSNNYGPYQFPEKLIPLMILNALADRPLPVYGDGQQIRDWLFVEDHCAAIRAVLQRGTPGEVYNIGGDSERANLDVVRQIVRHVNRHRCGTDKGPCDKLIQFVTDRPGHDRRYAVDTSKIRQQLGWKPRESFESGLASTVQWYLANSQWVERITSGKYRMERIGLKVA